MIADLIALAPHYGALLRGVTDAEMDELEGAAGQRFAPVYRQFLARMGTEMGQPLLNATFRFEHLLAYYQSTEWRPESRYALIGLDCGGPDEDVFLDQESTTNEGPRVVVFPKGQFAETLDEATRAEYFYVASPSLPQLIFDGAFAFVVLPQYPAEIQLIKSLRAEGAGALAGRCLEQLGLRRHPRSHAVRSDYLGQDFAVALHHEGGLALRIAGTAKADVGRVEEIPRDQLNPIIVMKRR